MHSILEAFLSISGGIVLFTAILTLLEPKGLYKPRGWFGGWDWFGVTFWVLLICGMPFALL